MITLAVSLLIFALLGVLAGFLILALNRARRRALTGPICGKCGYSALGLTAMTCPECGSDFRAVGILTPTTPRRTGPLAAYLLFTILLAPIALICTGAFLSVVPLRHSYDREIQLAGPHSKAYRRVVIHAHDQSWGAPRRALAVQIELVPNSSTTGPTSTANLRPPRMTVRPGEGYQYFVGASGVARQDAFGTDAVMGWMNAAGIDVSAKQVHQETARIAGQAQAASRNGLAGRSEQGLLGYSSSTSSGSDIFNAITSSETAESHMPPMAPIALVVFWLVAWIGGLNFLSGRRIRSKLTPVQTVPESAAMIDQV